VLVMKVPLFFQCGASFKTTVGGIASVGAASAALDAGIAITCNRI
jgi:hypothetical protein